MSTQSREEANSTGQNTQLEQHQQTEPEQQPNTPTPKADTEPSSTPSALKTRMQYYILAITLATILALGSFVYIRFSLNREEVFQTTEPRAPLRTLAIESSIISEPSHSPPPLALSVNQLRENMRTLVIHTKLASLMKEAQAELLKKAGGPIFLCMHTPETLKEALSTRKSKGKNTLSFWGKWLKAEEEIALSVFNNLSAIVQEYKIFCFLAPAVETILHKTLADVHDKFKTGCTPTSATSIETLILYLNLAKAGAFNTLTTGNPGWSGFFESLINACTLEADVHRNKVQLSLQKNILPEVLKEIHDWPKLRHVSFVDLNFKDTSVQGRLGNPRYTVPWTSLYLRNVDDPCMQVLFSLVDLGEVDISICEKTVSSLCFFEEIVACRINKLDVDIDTPGSVSQVERPLYTGLITEANAFSTQEMRGVFKLVMQVSKKLAFPYFLFVKIPLLLTNPSLEALEIINIPFKTYTASAVDRLLVGLSLYPNAHLAVTLHFAPIPYLSEQALTTFLNALDKPEPYHYVGIDLTSNNVTNGPLISALRSGCQEKGFNVSGIVINGQAEGFVKQALIYGGLWPLASTLQRLVRGGWRWWPGTRSPPTPAEYPLSEEQYGLPDAYTLERFRRYNQANYILPREKMFDPSTGLARQCDTVLHVSHID
ncbi:hypothetical protein NEDG_01130 [Nematocida displodere]|uniref:Uncharacterized protein n=1 Tax=Nematocida displodere TaxID=1805483 RepID=A0A177EBV8_9MICR|nr:hypothetical protein NEDG_01130 [Nematocida displodere]